MAQEGEPRVPRVPPKEVKDRGGWKPLFSLPLGPLTLTVDETRNYFNYNSFLIFVKF